MTPLSQTITIGSYAILKGQRKGRYHLEGGVVIDIQGIAAVLMCDDKRFVLPLKELVPFTQEYVTPRGNEIVPLEGMRYIVNG